MTNSTLIACTLSLAVALSGCGSGELSLTEYVERLNAVDAQASQRAEVIVDKAEQLTDFTPQDLQRGLELAGEIRIEVKEATDVLVPPEQIADLHDLIFDWHTRFIPIEAALAVRAGNTEDTDAGWTELSSSTEMAAYRSAILEGQQVCNDFQASMDDTSKREAFADVPWLPGEMSEVVEAVLGCDWFPDHPENLYQWPPPGSPTAPTDE